MNTENKTANTPEYLGLLIFISSNFSYDVADSFFALRVIKSYCRL